MNIESRVETTIQLIGSPKEPSEPITLLVDTRATANVSSRVSNQLGKPHPNSNWRGVLQRYVSLQVPSAPLSQLQCATGAPFLIN